MNEVQSVDLCTISKPVLKESFFDIFRKCFRFREIKLEALGKKHSELLKIFCDRKLSIAGHPQ